MCTFMCDNFSGKDSGQYKTMIPERREIHEVSCTITQPSSFLIEDNFTQYIKMLFVP